METQLDRNSRRAGRAHEEERRGGFRRSVDKSNAVIGTFGKWMADRQLQPMFLVDADLTALFLNRAAHNSIQRMDWIRCAEGEKLKILDPGLWDELGRAVVEWPKPGRSSIRLSSGTRAIDVAVIKEEALLAEIYVITLDPLEEQTVGYQLLMESFKLTEAEAQIVHLVHQGAARTSIATLRGSTINTVRSQMKRIFEKLGVRSQRELIRKISEWVATAGVI